MNGTTRAPVTSVPVSRPQHAATATPANAAASGGAPAARALATTTVLSAMIEPTESESKDELDAFVDTMKRIAKEAEETPDAQLVATIDAPAPGLTLLPGQTVDLAGSATGGTAPYTFEWSSEVNGTLGQGEIH